MLATYLMQAKIKMTLCQGESEWVGCSFVEELTFQIVFQSCPHLWIHPFTLAMSVVSIFSFCVPEVIFV